ncbi:HlyD family efflux transporter periplasmic adaptor subunit [Hydrogenophaga sp. MI9]|uniref:HlyD family efflux transporter periplasmic adaptor subunit n=1 Tax=Hydrogenophaga sp. MI9 TaxID=3453719 RepID=UPI003EEB27F2
MTAGVAVSVGGAVVPTAPPRKIPLPPIRDELILFAAAPNEDGTPAWMIQDPVTNRFYRIGWLDFELLVHWADNDAASLVNTVNEQTPLNVTEDDVRALVKFLADNQLLRATNKADVMRMLGRAQMMKRSLFETVLHNYLFFRLPLLRPQAWLAALRPYLARINMPLVAALILAITLVGVYLVSRQWDVFTHTLVDNMTWKGMFGYGFALVFAKAMHEMGHALAATRYGVRVAHMGVAFLVMFPMLYTDTGESWRLRDSRQRLAIAAAGIAVELALAGIATLAWTLAPEGSFRNGMFFLATTSWVMTVLINASPFMRFDGYFIASDVLDLPNLHERSGALAKTWMRRTLLGFDDKWPEAFGDHKRRVLIGFALFTWVYRLTVITGIAITVYFYFFKLLGIALMLVEVIWFIGKPVMRELEVWKKRRTEIHASRKRWLAGIVLALLVLLLFPFSSRVSGHGWYHAQEQQTIHAPFPAQIVAMPAQKQFKAGDVLFVLDSSQLSIASGKSRQMAKAREAQIAGLLGLPDGESQRQSLNSQKAYYEAEEKMNEDERGRLTLRAPFDGELRDIDHGLAPGVWVKPREPLGVLVDHGQWVIDAYIAEADMGRLKVGQEVRAGLMANALSWASGRIESIDVSRTQVLPTTMLDANNGGPIPTVTEATKEGQERTQVVRDALYRVRIALDKPLPTHQASTVRVAIEGRAESVAAGFFRRVASIFIRESGF